MLAELRRFVNGSSSSPRNLATAQALERRGLIRLTAAGNSAHAYGRTIYNVMVTDAGRAAAKVS
jgi:hypothetical protein